MVVSAFDLQWWCGRLVRVPWRVAEEGRGGRQQVVACPIHVPSQPHAARRTHERPARQRQCLVPTPA